MTLGEQFAAEVARVYDSERGGLELLPEVLAQTCARVLGVAGAGISMTMEGLRVPLGSSDEAVAAAERLQTTLGEGPCLDAVGSSQPLRFDLAAIADRWPVFHAEVLAQTPFRSISSVPIHLVGAPMVGALDLYSTEADGLRGLALDQVSVGIVDKIAALLFGAPAVALERGITLPLWLTNDAVTNRMEVWVAVGTLIELAGLTNDAALAALRAYAISHQLTLDQVAFQIADRGLKPDVVLS